MSDVKILSNIRPVQPAKEQDLTRRSERTGDSSFDDVMRDVQRGTQAANQASEKAGQITDRASLDKAMQEADAAHRDMMRTKSLLELAARMQTNKTDPSNKS